MNIVLLQCYKVTGMSGHKHPLVLVCESGSGGQACIKTQAHTHKFI